MSTHVKPGPITILLLSMMTFPTLSLAGAGSAVICQLPNDKEVCADPESGNPVATNTPEFTGGETRRLSLVIKGTRPGAFGGDFTYFLGALCDNAPDTCGIADPGACNSGADGACIPEVELRACQTGETIATRSVNELCHEATAATSPDYNLGAVRINDVPCVAGFAGGCCSAASTDKHEVTIQHPLFGCGFRLQRDASSTAFELLDDPPCVRTGLGLASSGGNTVNLDLLPQYLLQVQTNGAERVCQGGSNPGAVCTSSSSVCTGSGASCVDSVLQFTVVPIGGLALSFTVDTADFIGNSQALHNAIAAGFTALNLDLNVSSDSGVVNTSQFPELYAPGPMIRLANAGSIVTLLGVQPLSGATGLKIVQETSVAKLSLKL
jgi:hypothetical protein